MSWLLSALSLTRANRVVLLLLLLRCLMCTSTGCPLLVGRYDLPCNHETTLVQAILSSIFRPLLSTAASKLKVPPPLGIQSYQKNPCVNQACGRSGCCFPCSAYCHKFYRFNCPFSGPIPFVLLFFPQFATWYSTLATERKLHTKNQCLPILNDVS